MMKPEQLEKSDYPEYYQKYVALLPQKDLLYLLESQLKEMIIFINKLSNKDLLHSYAEGKWTVAEVIQHMIDTERIFQYRGLCIARKDKTSFPGYDQDAYVPVSGAGKRTAESFVEEYTQVRKSGICLFKSFDEDMLHEKGFSNGYPLSAGAAGFIIAGHEKHHLNLFRSSYKL